MKPAHFSKMLFGFTLILSCMMLKANALDMAGYLAVVNKSDNSISIINVSSGQIEKTLPTGKGPHELVLSPSGQIAVSTDFVRGDSLTVFDLKAQTVLRTLSLPKLTGPHGIQFLPDGEHVVFTSGSSSRVGIANVIRGELVDTITTKQQTSHMLTFADEAKHIYVTNIRSNSISVLNLEDRTKIKDISTEQQPEAIRIKSDGSQLWYGANKEGKVTVIEPESEKVLAQWDGFKFPYRVLFNQDQTIALVPDFRGHFVRFFDTQTFKEIGRIDLGEGAGPQGITLHPELDIAFLSLNLQNKIVAIDIKSREVVAEFSTGNNPDGVVFTNLL